MFMNAKVSSVSGMSEHVMVWAHISLIFLQLSICNVQYIVYKVISDHNNFSLNDFLY